MTFKFRPLRAGKLDASRMVGELTVTLRAENVRPTNTGTHALVKFYVEKTLMWSDTINVDKGKPDRHEFANMLYGTKVTPGKLNDTRLTAAYPHDVFAKEFMDWSTSLWQAWLGDSSGAYESGDEHPSAPPWSIPGVVMLGSTSIAAGEAGANKSTLYRLAAQSLTHGVDHVIPIQEQGPCIWVNAEESPAEHTRQLGNVNAALGLSRVTPMFTVHARGMAIADLAFRLEKAVRETGARHVFIDSLSRLAQGLSLNDNNTATLLVDSVAALGTSVNWIGHTGHENTHRLAGSRHFENAARVMVLVRSRMSIGGVSPELTRGVRASVYKANGAVQTVPLFWTLKYHRQHGLLSAVMSSGDEWPTLRCGSYTGESTCGRQTWDGVSRSGEVRCPRHRSDLDDET